MRECLNCQKPYEHKREASKFCSGKCRVAYNRKHPKNKITPVQLQVLYNSIMEAVEKITSQPSPAFFDGPPLKITYDEPPMFGQPQIALKSFEQWQVAKRECENDEDWEKIKAGIKAAQNLSPKQKDLLIKYS